MKKILFAILMFIPLMASAYDVEVDGIYYDLIAKGHLAKVTRNPDVRYTGDIVIPESFEYDGVTYTVVSIANSAFIMENITSVVIPNTVTTIEHAAFYHCERLRTITMGSGIQSISNQVFENCYNIESVYISDLAAWCKIEFSTYGGSNPLNNSDLYLNGEKITDLIIPSDVNSISENAFAYCSSFKSVTIPQSVTSMGRFVFRGCQNLTSATFENGVTFVGTRIFDGCDKLKTVNLANTITLIGEGAFWWCKSLESIDLPTGLRTIDESAFMYCSSLTELRIPKKVGSIGKNAFYECDGLKTIIIEENENLWSIGEGAFEKCKELSDVFCYTNHVPGTNENAFRESYIEYATLHVKSNLINDFKEYTPWKNFGSILAITGENPENPKCATPIINYVDGKILFSSETEGAQYVATISDTDIATHYSNEISLSVTYVVNVYATAIGHDNSDIATATLCWLDAEPKTEGMTNDIATARGNAILIQSNNGTINIAGVTDGTDIAVYSSAGMMVGSAKASCSSTSVPTGLRNGEIAIVKIGNKSVKVVMK